MKSARKNECGIYFAFLLYIFVNFFASCKNEPIFAAIEDEVKLKVHSVQGLVSGIVVVGDSVYCANPKYVFTKKIGATGKWTQLKDGPGGMCTSLATNGSELYAAFLEKGVYVYRGGEWQKIEGSLSMSKIVSGTSIIATNAENAIFRLAGSSFEKLLDSSGNQIKLGGTLQAGGGIYFSDAHAVYSYALGIASKLELSGLTNIKDICQGFGEKDVFVLTPASLYHYNGSSLGEIKHEVSSPWSVSYSKKYLLALVGGTQGYKEVQMKGTSLDGAFVRSMGEVDSSTPQSCFNQYNNSVGKWLLRPILMVDSSEGYVIYAGVGGSDSKYTGLWGFYNPGQLEWNRE